MSKRKYMRGERLMSIPDVMAERIVYIGAIQTPRHIEVVKSLTYRTIENYLNGTGIFKAAPYDGSSDRPLVHLEGQYNLFEVGESGSNEVNF